MLSTNIFQEIQQKRNNFKNYITKALEEKWINQEQYNDILYKIENDKLVIGVIGQMKAGKSTFLNALIFKDEILPAATTPMTASLAVITYGEEKKIEAEFYTSQEWDELNQFSLLNLEDFEGDSNQQAKIKAAKEIIEKSFKIANELPHLLGSKKTDAFENLIDYVGADGRYIAITKSVRIEYPLDYLKGVEIVDTPGFNDPVVSREERTKDFLSRADVVVMLLYAGRAFDATDNDIIFNKVRSIGVGKLLIGVNKYDINYLNGETNEEQIAQVKSQLLIACEAHSNNSIANLVREQDPLLVSANMALLSQLDLAKINSNADHQFHYNKFMNEFEISTQNQMYQKSLMPSFEEAIRQIVFSSKEEILIQKPLNYIKQIGENKIEELLKAKTVINNELNLLSKPDNDLEDILKNTIKAEKRMNRKIDILNLDINYESSSLLKKCKRQIEEELFNSKRKLITIIDDNMFILNKQKYFQKIEEEIDSLERNVKFIFDKFNDDLNKEIRKINYTFLSEIEELADNFLEDFEREDYLKYFSRHIQDCLISIDLSDLFISTEDDNDSDFLSRAGYFMYQFISGATLFTYSGIVNLASAKADLKSEINGFFNSFLIERLDDITSELILDLDQKIKNDLILEFVHPIVEETEKLLADKSNKENKVTELENKLENLKLDLNLLQNQVSEMKGLEVLVSLK